MVKVICIGVLHKSPAINIWNKNCYLSRNVILGISCSCIVHTLFPCSSSALVLVTDCNCVCSKQYPCQINHFLWYLSNCATYFFSKHAIYYLKVSVFYKEIVKAFQYLEMVLRWYINMYCWISPNIICYFGSFSNLCSKIFCLFFISSQRFMKL